MNSRTQFAQLIVLCVIALILAVGVIAILLAPQRAPATIPAQSGFPKAVPTATGATNFTDLNVTGELHTATFNASGAATFASTLSVTGASTFTGAATLSANPILPSESITPTNGGTITPTKVLVTLTPAGALGTALGACTTGQSLVLYNSVNANVVISDTGNFIAAGDQTLGQYDVLFAVCIGSKWVQVSAASAN